MTTSTTRKLTRFQYAAAILGGLAFVALAPAILLTPSPSKTAPAMADATTPTRTGTTSRSTTARASSSMGRPSPAVVERSPSPRRVGVGGVRPGQVGAVLSPVNEAPKKPVFTENVAVFFAQP